MIGQNSMREDLSIQIKSSIRSGTVIEPIFLAGPYGLGKTTTGIWIGEQIEQELKRPVHFECKSGSEFKDFDDIYEFIRDGTSGGEYKVRMIDEAHSIPKKNESLFNFFIDHILNGDEIAGIVIEPCTFIFATEFEEMVQESLRSRFVHSYRLNPYSVDDLIAIMKHHLPALRKKYKLKIPIEKYVLRYIAERGRRNARCVVNYFTKCLKEADKSLTVSVVKRCFDRNNIGDRGAKLMDQIVLYHLYIRTTKLQGGKPLSLNKIADQLSMNKDEIEHMIEPFLNMEGLLDINSRGRTLTPEGEQFVIERKEHLKDVYEKYRRGEM